MKKIIPLTLLALSPLLLTGCMTLRIGGSTEPMKMGMEGLINGFVDMDGIRPWDGTLAIVHVLDGQGSPGEIASVGIWPLVEVGVGAVGLRVQLLPLEFGLGTLLYSPKPNAELKPKKEEMHEITIEESRKTVKE